MANLQEEIADVTTTLFQIQMERNNLLKALRAQGENFNHFFRIYQDKYEALLKEKKTKPATFRYKIMLAYMRGENAPTLQFKYYDFL